ncbi:MAG: hypothetical protein ACFHWZ_15700 [Phycisphaerales bacterium]
MERVQTKALETLEALMDGPEPTGDPKQDAFIARERNRRRMAATQALIHIRTVQREERNAANARAKRRNRRGSQIECHQRLAGRWQALNPQLPTSQRATMRHAPNSRG